MAFTRFHDDKDRIEQQLQLATDPCNYILNVPGNGTKPCFMKDPSIRIQKWGANLKTNTIQVESDLLGMNRQYCRDHITNNNYKKHAAHTESIQYPTCQSYVEQPRLTEPAWTLKDLEYTRWDILHLDPQKNIFKPFQNNLHTRILEKDHYVPNIPTIHNT